MAAGGVGNAVSGGNDLCRELGSGAGHSDLGWKVISKMSQ